MARHLEHKGVLTLEHSSRKYFQGANITNSNSGVSQPGLSKDMSSYARTLQAALVMASTLLGVYDPSHKLCPPTNNFQGSTTIGPVVLFKTLSV